MSKDGAKVANYTDRLVLRKHLTYHRDRDTPRIILKYFNFDIHQQFKHSTCGARIVININEVFHLCSSITFSLFWREINGNWIRQRRKHFSNFCHLCPLELIDDNLLHLILQTVNFEMKMVLGSFMEFSYEKICTSLLFLMKISPPKKCDKY